MFQTIEINSANLASGTINLTPTLSSSPSPQLVYDFISAFEIKAGAALTVASDAAVQLNNGVTISVDPGATMTVGAASVVYQDTNNNVGGGIAVGGTLAATGTNFVKGGGGVTAGITVKPAGHLIATGTDFAWDGLTLYGGSVLNSGDLAKDSFNLTIAVPITDIPLLAGNVVFQTIEIDSANLASGTINLTPTLSSSPSPQLVYDFISAFEIKAGAALTVASDAAVQLNNGVTISVDPGATMTVGAASVVYQDTNNNVGGGIAVGGTLAATGTNFVKGGGGVTAGITVQPAGHLTATGADFAWDGLTLYGGSVLNSGDLAKDSFNLTIAVPITDIPLLAGNVVFQTVEIDSANLASGVIELTNALSSSPSPQLLYVFPAAFEIRSGATLVVANGVGVQINNGVTISVDAGASMTVGGASVVYQDTNNNVGGGIAVAGTLTDTGTSFGKGGGGVTAFIQVNPAGQLVATNTTFGWDSLQLNAGTSDQLATNVVNTAFTINSGATESITGNNFSNGTVVAAGDSTATINLTNNYWGTTTTALIEAKITDHHVNSSLPTVSFSPPLTAANPPGAATTIVAASTVATYNANASQSITLSASVTSGSVTPTGGTVTFILMNGTAMVGNAVTATVNSSGIASTNMLLPAGTVGSKDSILAIYDGTAKFLGSFDASHTVTVNPATTTTAASNASDVFSSVGSQMVTVNATVMSANGTVNAGTETFTILAGNTPVGSPVTVNVVNGAAGATYAVPAGTHANSYTIEAVYSGTANFKTATDTTHLLTVGAATTTIASVNTSTTFSASTQTVTLTAAVTSSGGTVNEATVTFTVLSGSTPIGPAVSVPISSGGASTSYTLPAGLSGSVYTIKAVYDGGTDFKTSTDTSHTLTVNPAATTTAAANVTTTFSSTAHAVTLTATVTSTAGTVGEGSETFTILNGTQVIGAATSGNLAGGKVSVSYTIPANTAAGSYTIKAVYNGTAEFLTAMDNSHVLTITAATATPAAIAATNLASTGDDGAATVVQNALAAPPKKNGVGTLPSKAAHKTHLAQIKIKRGPLTLVRPATTKHVAARQSLAAAAKRLDTRVDLVARR